MTSNDTSSSQSGAGAGTGHHQDFRLGSDTRIHNDVEMNAKAPGMKFTSTCSGFSIPIMGNINVALIANLVSFRVGFCLVLVGCGDRRRPGRLSDRLTAGVAASAATPRTTGFRARSLGPGSGGWRGGR
ncbi:hypothetical protein BDV98DRAFT_73383 [Pterulicium gracile]|uniref:Uncharacterized protein n=1 Tax=Pterulicium gracile TaxID=1884261 RepID=A0A5C3QI80_9AGAR|nr:hypothetical protein BDV98DRAFT_73383 [Pterula gracilis]